MDNDKYNDKCNDMCMYIYIYIYISIHNDDNDNNDDNNNSTALGPQRGDARPGSSSRNLQNLCLRPSLTQHFNKSVRCDSISFNLEYQPEGGMRTHGGLGGETLGRYIYIYIYIYTTIYRQLLAGMLVSQFR